MRSVRRRIEELLWATSTFAVARSAYRLTTPGRRMVERLNSLRGFYRPLVPQGALVFDIGANKGHYSFVFSQLGLRTVAVEPNPDCVRHIQIAYGEGIETLQAAVGERNGLTTLYLSDQRDDLSSLSEGWLSTLQRIRPDYRGLTARKLTVPLVTLNSLIEQFGVPYYIKIDVEGSEEKVLEGLSLFPQLLSFECNLAFLEQGIRCLEHKALKGCNRYNLSTSWDSMEFVFPGWVDKEDLKNALTNLKHDEDHPVDIFIKSYR